MFEVRISMSEEITIPKKEYEFLVKCKEILSIESDEDFKPELLTKLEKAEKEIKSGKGIVLTSREEVAKYLKSK
jgi:hypothetical protein